jgi:hypothetical protein
MSSMNIAYIAHAGPFDQIGKPMSDCSNGPFCRT